MNKVLLIGNVGRDPEVRVSTSGVAICNVSLATTKKWKGEDVTEWHSLVAFCTLSDTFKNYVSKGDKIAVVGELKTRTWEDDNGKKNYKTEVIVNELEFVSKGKESASEPTKEQAVESKVHDTPFDDELEDIPF